jgi:hypothetical protein
MGNTSIKPSKDFIVRWYSVLQAADRVAKSQFAEGLAFLQSWNDLVWLYSIHSSPNA